MEYYIFNVRFYDGTFLYVVCFQFEYLSCGFYVTAEFRHTESAWLWFVLLFWSILGFRGVLGKPFGCFQVIFTIFRCNLICVVFIRTSLISSAFRYDSFTCHQTQTIPAFNPQPQSITTVGWYSLCLSMEDGQDLGCWLGPVNNQLQWPDRLHVLWWRIVGCSWRMSQTNAVILCTVRCCVSTVTCDDSLTVTRQQCRVMMQVVVGRSWAHPVDMSVSNCHTCFITCHMAVRMSCTFFLCKSSSCCVSWLSCSVLAV